MSMNQILPNFTIYEHSSQANIFWRKIEFESHQEIQNLLPERETPIKGIKT
jgi:hypothetical protein